MSTTNPLIKFLSRALMLWIGLVFTAAGMAGVYTSFNEWQTLRRFEREAIEAEGIVVAKSIVGADRESNTSTQYLVTYRFTSLNGGAIEQTEPLAADDWEQLGEGDPLGLRYLPSDPSTAQTRLSSQWWAPLLVLGVCSLFVLIGLLLAVPQLRRAATILRLVRSGVATDGTVINVWPTSTTINRVQQWQMSYEFRDQYNRAQRAESDLMSPAEAAGFKPGDRGTVRYERERPANNLWVGR